MLGVTQIDYLAKGVLKAMTSCKRTITKEQYDKLVNEHDSTDIFSQSEVCGYGVYCIVPHKNEEKGEYWVTFEMGSSCD